MMTEAIDLTNRLRPFGDDIARWRQEVASLRTKVQEALDAKSVQPETLTMTERSADEIYAAIDRFDALKADVAEASPRAAGQLAEVGDALRLVLLEMTELTTRMYGVRSMTPAGVEPMSEADGAGEPSTPRSV